MEYLLSVQLESSGVITVNGWDLELNQKREISTYKKLRIILLIIFF